MGSEQSTAGGSAGGGRADRVRAAETPLSPQNSVCSDGEVPYVSYTHNLPIGEAESPRHAGRRLRPGRSRARQPALPKEIVVVKQAASPAHGAQEEDPDLRRLRLIPTFLPVMRGALTYPGSRDPDVLDRLDSVAVRHLAARLQRHLAANADRTAAKQAEITAAIGKLDQQSAALLATVTDRQKAFARHAERLQKVGEVAHSVQRCHRLLEDTTRQLAELNRQLPESHRLPPFTWTTG
ncbi:BLOC-1-related complex subunit 5-like [Amphibalanus amphitrite]|uniref:BLOC-1-related complex subunit 5-like n=1 Tax=Amphibalanus amphitrite TaxID=1232801 RepID=UPI001C917BD7|nr:BLOC-1-related complex subunit 5-like [Amphibalanus amphitrite]XP_043212091.1 BLOC-1-related complex subunit 5-like [Amphibalanus amphitrite]XP_043219172.1 BLOC-1-related complex subunit 5-like [Amphibalanus amphitrite]